VDPATVESVALQPETLAEALREGKVDVIAVWEPFAYSAVQASRGDLAVIATQGVYRETFNLVAANKHVTASSTETARLLRAIDRANTFIAEQPAKAQALLRERLGVDDAFVQSIWPNVRYRLSLDQGLLMTLESEARWAIRESHVKADRIPNFLPLFYTAPMLSVKPDSAGIAR
jgi:NitT/TauT family transport system substrate-binding protein